MRRDAKARTTALRSLTSGNNAFYSKKIFNHLTVKLKQHRYSKPSGIRRIFCTPTESCSSGQRGHIEVSGSALTQSKANFEVGSNLKFRSGCSDPCPVEF